MVRVAKYRRVSSLTSKDGASLETQDDDLNKRIIEKGYYCDETRHNYEEVFTGTVWRERKVLQDMLEAASRQEFDVLLIHHTDRLAREDHLTIIIEQLAYYGVRVESYLQELEETPAGKLMLAILAYTARQHRDRIIEATMRGKRKRATEKALHGGVPLYGYKWENEERGVKHFGARNKYIYNDDVIHVDADGIKWSERKVVEEIFRLSKAGYTIWGIRTYLNAKGIPTRSGTSPWSHSMIGAILRKKAYTGTYTSYEYQTVITYSLDKIHKHKVPRPPEEQVSITIPAIIDEDTFTTVQAQLARNKQFAARNNENPEISLLRGLILCGYCGKPLTTRYNYPEGSSSYYCRGAHFKTRNCKTVQISGTIIDDIVWQYACGIIRDPKKLQASIEKLKNPDPEVLSGAALKKRLTEIAQEIKNLVALGKKATSDTALEDISFSMQLLETEQAGLLEDEQKLKVLHLQWEKVQAEILRFNDWCVSYREKLDTATYQQKRIAFEMLGIQVKIFKYGEKDEQGRPKRYRILVAPPQILKIVSRVC